MYEYDSTVADRYLYLAMLGPALALAIFLKRHSRPSFYTVSALVLFVLAIMSFRRRADLAGQITLFGYTLRHNPRSWQARINLGHMLEKQGKKEEARNSCIAKP